MLILRNFDVYLHAKDGGQTFYSLLFTVHSFTRTFYWLLVTFYSLLFTLLFHSLLIIFYSLFLFINFYYLIVKLWKLSDVKSINITWLSINNFRSLRCAVRLIGKTYVSTHLKHFSKFRTAFESLYDWLKRAQYCSI